MIKWKSTLMLLMSFQWKEMVSAERLARLYGACLSSLSLQHPIRKGEFKLKSKNPEIARGILVLQTSSRKQHKVTPFKLFANSYKEWSCDDIRYMKLALQCASEGYGVTFPNPAVGCVLVDNRSKHIVGKGFHPKAGMPHAEIFALLEASGAISSGMEAARTLLSTRNPQKEPPNTILQAQVKELLRTYSSEGGAQLLFKDCCTGSETTAYVTLEPCCHYGQTPPCAMSLAHAGVSRVVIAVRDRNPRVNGGGVKVLLDSNVTVDILPQVDLKNETLLELVQESHRLVKYFMKRITTPGMDYEELLNGAHRRALRRLAGQQKSNGTIVEMPSLTESQLLNTNEVDLDSSGVPSFQVLPPWWLEELDRKLWENELVLVKLNGLTHKKKLTNQLGTIIAASLNAHVAQTLGHTVLLYRPDTPEALIQLQQLGSRYQQ